MLTDAYLKPCHHLALSSLARTRLRGTIIVSSFSGTAGTAAGRNAETICALRPLGHPGDRVHEELQQESRKAARSSDDRRLGAWLEMLSCWGCSLFLVHRKKRDALTRSHAYRLLVVHGWAAAAIWMVKPQTKWADDVETVITSRRASADSSRRGWRSPRRGWRSSRRSWRNAS